MKLAFRNLFASLCIESWRQDLKNLLWHFWCFLNYIDVKFNEKTQEKRNKKMWCRSWISKKMCWVGYYHNLTNELKIEDKKGFKNFFRMSPNNFWFLANKVASCISKQNTIKFHITSINVLSLVPSSERNVKFHSAWRKAYARKIRLYYPYQQYKI